MHELFELGKHLGVGPVGAAVVIDDEGIVGWVIRRVTLRWSTGYIDWRMSLLVVRGAFFMGSLETSDEEFAREGNVDVHVTVHGVFTQQINTEFFACFCETP